MLPVQRQRHPRTRGSKASTQPVPQGKAEEQQAAEQGLPMLESYWPDMDPIYLMKRAYLRITVGEVPIMNTECDDADENDSSQEADRKPTVSCS
jgi:hypothetical protein